MSICCPLCCKVGEGGNPTVDGGFAENVRFENGEGVQKRFFQLFLRYLDDHLNHGEATRVEEDGIGENTQFFFPSEEFVGIGMICWGDCSKIMESFCELYNQLKIIELRLNWQVLKVKEILKASGKVKSRMEGFREYVGKLELGEGRWRDPEKLIEFIVKSRKSLISKCSKKVKRSYPKLSLSNCKGAKLSKGLNDKLPMYEPINDVGASSHGNSLSLLNSPVTACGSGRGSKKRKLSNQSEPRSTVTSTANTSVDQEHHTANSENQFYHLDFKCPDCSLLHADANAKKILCSFCRKPAEIHCRQGLANLTSPPSKVARDATTDTNRSSDDVTDDPRGTSTAVENRIPDDDQLSTHDSDAGSTRDDASYIDSVVSLNAPMNKEAPVSRSLLKSQLPPVKPALEHDVIQIPLENPNPPKPPIDEVTSSHAPRKRRMSRLRSTHRCEHCGRTFSSNERLKAHQQEDHIDDDQGDQLKFREFHKDGVDVDDMESDNYCPPSSDDEYEGPDIEPCYEDEIEGSSTKCGSSETLASKSKSVCLKDTSDHIGQPAPLDESNAKNMAIIAGRQIDNFPEKCDKQCEGFRLKCPDCNILYEDTKSLLTHRMTSEPCKASYDPTASVKVEVLVSPGDGNTHQEDFTRLVATIDLPQAIFICEVEECGLALYTLEDMYKHKELHGTFPCKFCKIEFTYAPELAKHELQHSKQKRKGNAAKIYCSRCDFNCERRFILYANHHLKTHLSLTFNQSVCAICKSNSLYFNGWKLADHFKKCHDVGNLKTPEGKLECSVNSCDAYFLTRRQLYNHLKLRHNIDTEKNIKCKDCDKTFAKIINLQEHRLAYHVRKDKVIRCPVKRCNRAFELKKDLEHHMKIYSAKHKNMEKCCSLKCPYCNRLFGNMKTILLHLKDSTSCGKTYDPTTTVRVSIYVTPNSERNIKKLKGDASPLATIDLPLEIYICKTCGVATYSKKDEKIHEKLHGLFPCDFCDFTSSYAPKLSMHELQHCPEKRTRGKDGNFSTYNCPRCDFQKSVGADNRKNYVRHHLKEHFSLTHNVQPECVICKTTPSDKYNLGEHLKTFHDISDVKNPNDIKRCTEAECKAYFLTNSQLQSHLKRRHNKAKPTKFTCQDCGENFGKFGYLRRHRLKSHVELDKAIPCCIEDCAQKFESQEDMIRHVLAVSSHKPNADAKDVQCPTCDAVVSGTDPKILIQHLRSQHGTEKPTHVCEHCGKIFQHKNNLDVHYLTHSGPAGWEFMCSVCAKKCMTKQKLEEHMRTHTEDKPFVCGVCGLKYAHRHNLRIHVNSKHGDQVKDVPRQFKKTNLTSRKGIKRKHYKI